ncbi:hypothetical protein FKM82_023196 [Ascaphus truei]
MRSEESFIKDGNEQTRGCKYESTKRDKPSPKDPIPATIGRPGGLTSDLWIFGRWWNTGITGCGLLRKSISCLLSVHRILPNSMSSLYCKLNSAVGSFFNNL